MLLSTQLDGRLHLDLALDDIHSGDRTIIRLAWQWNGSMAIILAHEDVSASAAAAIQMLFAALKARTGFCTDVNTKSRRNN